MSDSFSDKFLNCLLIMLLASLVMLVLSIPTILVMTPYSQYKYCEKMDVLTNDYEFDYSFWSGCLVKTPTGYWTNSQDYFKYVNIDLNQKEIK